MDGITLEVIGDIPISFKMIPVLIKIVFLKLNSEMRASPARAARQSYRDWNNRLLSNERLY